MLEENDVAFTYREYKREPLGEDELRAVLRKLGKRASEVLRRRDRAFRTLGLTGEEDDDTLVRHMAAHPTLLERPIGVTDTRAVVGRPPDALLSLIEP